MMTAWVTKVDRTIRHITISIPRLRIGRVGNDCVGLHKAVEIRRTRTFLRCYRALRYLVNGDEQETMPKGNYVYCS